MRQTDVCVCVVCCVCCVCGRGGDVGKNKRRYERAVEMVEKEK